MNKLIIPKLNVKSVKRAAKIIKEKQKEQDKLFNKIVKELKLKSEEDKDTLSDYLYNGYIHIIKFEK